MHELSNLNDYIDAVLLNNPYAVQEKLQQLGVLQDEGYDPDYLKQVIVREINRPEGGQDALFLLPEYLDVPVNHVGPYADELLGQQLTHGNRAMIESLLLRQAVSTPSPEIDWSRLLEWKISWQIAFMGLGLVTGLLFIIFLIRKI